MPIWILYWFPFILPVNFVIKSIVINIIVWIFKIITKRKDVYRMFTAIKSFSLTILSEIVGIVIFSILEMNVKDEIFHANYMMFCFIPFFCVAILNFALNYTVVLRKTNIPTKQKIMFCISIIIMTVPYAFLLPSDRVY